MPGFESQQLSTERRRAPCKPQEAMPGFESQQLSTERRSAQGLRFTRCVVLSVDAVRVGIGAKCGW